jgi:hypothetical protein
LFDYEGIPSKEPKNLNKMSTKFEKSSKKIQDCSICCQFLKWLDPDPGEPII